ncbi:DUF433 domain-containing protein [bacterium]|nr:DUF433 domain-containing protein [bacterium]
MDNGYQKRIIVDEGIMIGKPVIKGTRITVELVLKLLTQGQTIDAILENYPNLVREDIYAALEYAAHVVEEEKSFPFAALQYA